MSPTGLFVLSFSTIIRARSSNMGIGSNGQLKYLFSAWKYHNEDLNCVTDLEHFHLSDNSFELFLLYKVVSSQLEYQPDVKLEESLEES